MIWIFHSCQFKCELKMCSLYGESTVCFCLFFVVVCSFSTPRLFSLHFQFSSFHSERYFSPQWKKRTENEKKNSICRFKKKKEKKLFGGPGYYLNGWIVSGLTLVLLFIILFWGRQSAPPVLPCRSVMICTLNQRNGLLVLFWNEEYQTEASWKLTMNYLIKVL